MANKRKYDALLEEILLPNGFYKHGSNFLRLHGDGVLQSVYFLYEPHTKYVPEWGDGNCLCIATHSVYEHRVFEPVKSLKGQLTMPKMVGPFCGFEYGKEPKKDPDCRRPKTEYEQLDLLQENAIKVLDMVDSQSALCQLLKWVDITETGSVTLVDTSNIWPLAYLHCYEEALQFCDGIINQNLHGLKQKEEYLTPDQLLVQRTWMEKQLQPIFKIKELMLKNEHEAIQSLLQSYRTENLDTLAKLYPKAKKEGLV